MKSRIVQTLCLAGVITTALLSLTGCVSYEPEIQPLVIHTEEDTQIKELPKTGDKDSSGDKDYQDFLDEEAERRANGKGWFECEDHYQWRIKKERDILDYSLQGSISTRDCGIFPEWICNLLNIGKDLGGLINQGGWETCTFNGPGYNGRCSFEEKNPEPASFCLFGSLDNQSKQLAYTNCP